MRPEAPRDPSFEGTVEPAGEGRLARSRRLTKTAFRLMWDDGLIFVLAAIATAATVVATLLVFGLGGYFDNPRHTGAHFALVLLIATFPLTFLGTFFNVAIAAAAAARLEGRRMDVKEAFGVAVRRLPQIALWSLLATGVGILLREIASRLPFGGKLATWLLGAAWGLATLLVVPILALEGCTAPACVKRSASLMRERWGEGLTGTVAVTAIFSVISIPCGFLLGFGGSLYATDRSTGIALIVIGVALLLVVSSAATAVRQVFTTALYRFATRGEVSGGFTAQYLER